MSAIVLFVAALAAAGPHGRAHEPLQVEARRFDGEALPRLSQAVSRALMATGTAVVMSVSAAGPCASCLHLIIIQSAAGHYRLEAHNAGGVASTEFAVSRDAPLFEQARALAIQARLLIESSESRPAPEVARAPAPTRESRPSPRPAGVAASEGPTAAAGSARPVVLAASPRPAGVAASEGPIAAAGSVRPVVLAASPRPAGVAASEGPTAAAGSARPVVPSPQPESSSPPAAAPHLLAVSPAAVAPDAERETGAGKPGDVLAAASLRGEPALSPASQATSDPAAAKTVTLASPPSARPTEPSIQPLSPAAGAVGRGLRTEPAPSSRPVWPWVATSIGVGLGAAAGTCAYLARRHYSALDDRGQSLESAAAHRDDGSRLQTAALILGGAGVAALTAGVVGMLWKAQPKTGVAVAPSQAGLMVFAQGTL